MVIPKISNFENTDILIVSGKASVPLREGREGGVTFGRPNETARCPK